MEELPVLEYELTGGELCLDFTNTVGGSRHHKAIEYLRNYNDLLEWSRQVGIITPEEQDHLRREAASHPEEAAQVYQRAIRLREALYRIFSNLAGGGQPAREDVSILNEELAGGMPSIQILPDPQGFQWGWKEAAGRLDAMLAPVVHSAAKLLTSSDLERVRECASDACTWVFLDRTRNHSRQWCDMRSCGNVSKVRRYRQRKREQEQ